MFFRSRQHEPTGESPRVANVGDAGTDEATLRQAEPLVTWRRSAQRVTRAWNAWLAAETRDHGVRYRAFVVALAGEERAAAELERVIGLVEAPRHASATPTPKSGLGAR